MNVKQVVSSRLAVTGLLQATASGSERCQRVDECVGCQRVALLAPTCPSSPLPSLLAPTPTRPPSQAPAYAYEHTHLPAHTGVQARV
jgi:hypothetical protein